MSVVKAHEWKLVRIRLMTEDDFPDFLRANHNPDIEQLSGGIYPMYPDELKEYYEDEMKDGSVCFVVELQKTGKVIGEVGLHDIKQGDKVAEISITVFDEENHGKWYGSDALEILIRYAFEYLSMRKLVAWIYAHNTPSITLFEKYGFECNGRQKSHKLIRGKYEDCLVYEKFRGEEFKNAIPISMKRL